jgi:hypothetical protein
MHIAHALLNTMMMSGDFEEAIEGRIAGDAGTRHEPIND